MSTVAFIVTPACWLVMHVEHTHNAGPWEATHRLLKWMFAHISRKGVDLRVELMQKVLKWEFFRNKLVTVVPTLACFPCCLLLVRS